MWYSWKRSLSNFDLGKKQALVPLTPPHPEDSVSSDKDWIHDCQSSIHWKDFWPSRTTQNSALRHRSFTRDNFSQSAAWWRHFLRRNRSKSQNMIIKTAAEIDKSIYLIHLLDNREAVLSFQTWIDVILLLRLALLPTSKVITCWCLLLKFLHFTDCSTIPQILMLY